uniref:Conserved fungal protein n=1 Tax=Melanopsichium pennsylvanicum 4 TaxID=1398559 RepID=A0A077R812_9BASI|nr:conserved fungal protein [Melanopsichium pennsylvanicum 4]
MVVSDDSILPDLLGNDKSNEYGGFFQFLTMCGLLSTTLTMGLALVFDLIGGPKALLWTKDLSMAISLPAEVMITLLYWSLLAINKELLMQPRQIVDPANPGLVVREEPIAVPFSIDASLHAFPGIFLLVDFLLLSRQFPESISMVAVSAAVTVSYTLWAEQCAKMNGHYPYPLLDIMTWPQRTTFYAAAGISACFVGLALTRLQMKMHGPLSAKKNNEKRN